MKQDRVMSIIEGKQPLYCKGYKFLANKAFEQQNDYNISISCHLFLILCWNLIARRVLVGSLMYYHIPWTSDMMVIVFPSRKSDKEGKNALPKHTCMRTQRSHTYAQYYLWLCTFYPRIRKRRLEDMHIRRRCRKLIQQIVAQTVSENKVGAVAPRFHARGARGGIGTTS